MPLKRSISLLLFFVMIAGSTHAQKYNFEHFDIEDGLAQSQVLAIAQDHNHHLWLATLAGISSFNGTTFKSFTKTDGLNSNFTTALTTDAKNNVWIGTARGLSRRTKLKFYAYKNSKNWVSQLATEKNGNVYGLIDRSLYTIYSSTIQKSSITGDTAEKVSALKTDYQGKLWAAVYQKGLFYHHNNRWVEYAKGLNKHIQLITDVLIDRTDPSRIWLLNSTGVFILHNKKLTKFDMPVARQPSTIAQDDDGNIWIGTNTGAFCIKNNKVLYFNKSNGFTDNRVNYIYKDLENNIWLATDGEGIYRFNTDSYEIIDESQGLRNNIIMGLANDTLTNDIWLGTYGGLFHYKHSRINEIPLTSSNHAPVRINTIFKDRKNQIWVGTPGTGLLMYDGRSTKRMDLEPNMLSYHAILEDQYKRIWLATNAGCLILDQPKKTFTRVTKIFSNCLEEIGKDSLIAGTQDGAYLIRNLKETRLTAIKDLEGSSILSIKKHKELVFFGTNDNGLIVWNMHKKRTTRFNTKSGLVSDHVYSILADDKGILWLGTGKGINKIRISDLSIIKHNENDLMVECNQNAIIQHRNKVWVGTTKGAIVYTKEPRLNSSQKPYIYISSVNISPKNKSKSTKHLTLHFNAQTTKKAITLPFKQNNLSINFSGIYLTDPKAVSYQYRLLGLDAKFGERTSNTSVNYSALPAGSYTFQVKALIASNPSLANTASFKFEIQPPYYQSFLFRLLMILLVILLVMLIVGVILQLNERKRKLRLKIKLEEQFKIRKQTAEDFHDDLGNKLTRISVLSDVLLSLVDEHDLEKRSIINKISSNVNELYTGTKDILWSLNPKNDRLNDLLAHIIEFGKELFDESQIEFFYDIQTYVKTEEVKLPLEVSRNILMIFKEAMHNSLKHSHAKNVKFTVQSNNELFEMKLEDDGIGFNTRIYENGHGINNLNVRAKRIDSFLIINSGHDGTAVNLFVKYATLNITGNA